MSTLIVRNPLLRSMLMEVSRDLAPARTDVRSLSLPVDVVEDSEGYTVSAALPGINPAEIEINFQEQVLTISGEIRQPTLAEGAQYRIRERAAGRFERALKFSQAIDGEAVQASYEHGVLTLRLPRAERARPRKITVNVAQPTIEG